MLAEQIGESRNQIQRYVRLTFLNPQLLAMVDERKNAFNPAVELSYLKEQEQLDLLDAMDMEQTTPSLADYKENRNVFDIETFIKRRLKTPKGKVETFILDD